MPSPAESARPYVILVVEHNRMGLKPIRVTLEKAGPLAHRYGFFAFPNALDRADHVLLDTARQCTASGIRRATRRSYSGSVPTPAYQLLFDQEGVLLLKQRRRALDDVEAVS